MGYVWQLPHSIIIQTISQDGYKQETYFSDKTFKMAPSSRPVAAPPQLYKKELTSNWLDGVVDISNVLEMNPLLGHRTCEIEFYVLNELDDISVDPWNERYDQLISILNGQKCYLTLQDDILPNTGFYYMKGRVHVKSWKSEKDRSKVTLLFKLSPIKPFVKAPPESWEGGNPPTPDFDPPWDPNYWWKRGNPGYEWKWNNLFGTDVSFGYFAIDGSKGHIWRDIINPTKELVRSNVMVSYTGNVAVTATRYDEFDYSRTSSHGATITFTNGMNEEKLILNPGHNYYYFTTGSNAEVLVMKDGMMEVRL